MGSSPLTPLPTIKIILYSWILVVTVTFPTRSLQHQNGAIDLFKQTNFPILSTRLTSSLSAIMKLQKRLKPGKAGLDSVKKRSANNVNFSQENVKEFTSQPSYNSRYSKLLQIWRREMMSRTWDTTSLVFQELLVRVLKHRSHLCTMHYPSQRSNQRHNCPKLTIVLHLCVHLNSECMKQMSEWSSLFQGKLNLSSWSMNTFINNITQMSTFVLIVGSRHPIAIKVLFLCKADVISKILRTERALLLVLKSVSFQMLPEKGSTKHSIFNAHKQRSRLCLHYKRHSIKIKIFHEATQFVETFYLHNSWFWFYMSSIEKSFFWLELVSYSPTHQFTRHRLGTFVKGLRRYCWLSVDRHISVKAAWCMIDYCDPDREQIVCPPLFLRDNFLRLLTVNMQKLFRLTCFKKMSFTREKSTRKSGDHRGKMANRAINKTHKTRHFILAFSAYKRECNITCSKTKRLMTNIFSPTLTSLLVSEDHHLVVLNIPVLVYNLHMFKHKVDVFGKSGSQKATPHRNSQQILLKYILKLCVPVDVSMSTEGRNLPNSSHRKRMDKRLARNYLNAKIKHTSNGSKIKRSGNYYYRSSDPIDSHPIDSHTQETPMADTDPTDEGYKVSLKIMDRILRRYAELYRRQDYVDGQPVDSVQDVDSSLNVYRTDDSEHRRIKQGKDLSEHIHSATELEGSSQDNQPNTVNVQRKRTHFIFEHVNRSYHDITAGLHIYKENRSHYSPLKQSFLRNRKRDGIGKPFQHRAVVNMRQDYARKLLPINIKNQAPGVLSNFGALNHLSNSESRDNEKKKSKNNYFSFKKPTTFLIKRSNLKLLWHHLFKPSNDNNHETKLHDIWTFMNTLLTHGSEYPMTNTSTLFEKHEDFERQFTRLHKREINFDNDLLIKASVLKDIYIRWSDMKREITKLRENIYKAKERLIKVQDDLLLLIRRGYSLAAAHTNVASYNKLRMYLSQVDLKLVQKEFLKLKNEIYQLQNRREIAERNVYAIKAHNKFITGDLIEEGQSKDGTTVDNLLHANTQNGAKTLMVGAGRKKSRFIDDHYNIVEFFNGDISKPLNILTGLSAEDPDLVQVGNILKGVMFRNKRDTLVDHLNGNSESALLTVRKIEKRWNDRNNFIKFPKAESIIQPHRKTSTTQSSLSDDSNYLHMSHQMSARRKEKRQQSLMLLDPTQLLGKQSQQDFTSIWWKLKENGRKSLTVVRWITLIYTQLQVGIRKLQNKRKAIDVEIYVFIKTSNFTSNPLNYRKVFIIKMKMKKFHAEINQYKKMYERNKLNEIVRNVNEKMETFQKALDDEESQLQGQLNSVSDPHTFLPFSARTISSWRINAHSPDSGERFTDDLESNSKDSVTEYNGDGTKSLHDFNVYVKEVSSISDLEHVQMMLNKLIAEHANERSNHARRREVYRAKRALRIKRRGRSRGGRRGSRHRSRYYSSTNIGSRESANKRGKVMSGRNVAATLPDGSIVDNDLELYNVASSVPNDEAVEQAEKALNAELSYREILGDKDLLVIRDKDFDTVGRKTNNPFLIENLRNPIYGKKPEYLIAKLPSEDKRYSSQVEPYLWKLTNSRDDKEHDEDALDNTRAVSTYIHSPPTKENLLREIDGKYLTESIETRPAVLSKIDINDKILAAAKQLQKDEITNAKSLVETDALTPRKRAPIFLEKVPFDNANDVNEDFQEITRGFLGNTKDGNKERGEIEEGDSQTQDDNVNNNNEADTGSNQYFINKFKSHLRKTRTPRKTMLVLPNIEEIPQKLNTALDVRDNNTRIEKGLMNLIK